jgi:hypothetical protein
MHEQTQLCQAWPGSEELPWANSQTQAMTAKWRLV